MCVNYTLKQITKKTILVDQPLLTLYVVDNSCSFLYVFDVAWPVMIIYRFSVTTNQTPDTQLVHLQNTKMTDASG